MNNWKEILENRLKTCDELIDDTIDFDALSEIEYFEKVEKFLNLESALLQSLLKNLDILKPNESKTVNRNESLKRFCAYCGAKLEHELPTDINSKLVCKSGFCKIVNGVR